MTTRLSSASTVILEAQCAFIRDERRTQRHQRHLFMHANGAPTARQVALTELIDAVTDDAITRLHALPEWGGLQPVVRTQLELLTEACLRGASGCAPDVIQAIEGFAADAVYAADGSPMSSTGDDHWSLSGLYYSTRSAQHGEVVWTIVIPREVADGALAHVERV